MRKQPLRATTLRNAHGALLRVLRHNGLEYRRDAVSHTPVDAGVAEVLDAPALHRLQNEGVGRGSEDGRLLRAERKEGDPLGGRADLAAEGVHRSNGCVALHERQSEAAEGDRANGDSLDDVHEVRVEVGRLLKRAQQGASW